MRAGAYGCRYSHHEDKKGAGYITTAEARAIMREMGATEPGDHGAIILAFSQPMICRQDNGSEHWPINSGPRCAEDLAWSSEEHTSELQSLMRITYAVFCLKKKNTITKVPINKMRRY